jgi:hypothetical protein
VFIFSGKLDIPFEEYEAYLYLALQFKLWQLEKLIKLRLEKAKTFGKFVILVFRIQVLSPPYSLLMVSIIRQSVFDSRLGHIETLLTNATVLFKIHF